MTIDPVCGMEVDEKKAASKEDKGKRYYFCSPTCQWAFDMNPQQFVGFTEVWKPEMSESFYGNWARSYIFSGSS